MCEVKHGILTCRTYRPLPSFCTYQPRSQYFIPDFERCILPQNISAIFYLFTKMHFTSFIFIFLN